MMHRHCLVELGTRVGLVYYLFMFMYMLMGNASLANLNRKCSMCIKLINAGGILILNIHVGEIVLLNHVVTCQ